VIDVLHSHWQCTVEREADESLSLRMGLLYVKGLRQQTALALLRVRVQDGPFRSTDDLALRVPELNQRELKQLARVGALNSLGGVQHRRDALWQVEQAGRPVGPLLRQRDVLPLDEVDASPLRQMSTEERLIADYSGTGVTVGRHPMAYRREELHRRRILSAQELQQHHDGAYVRAAGCVIARQRPGTAKGFIFLSMEDETGIMNVIIGPDLYERERILISRGKFLLVEGRLQNQDTVVHVRAERVLSLQVSEAAARSHDFH
jgi:error-prone DNA polymerase